MIKFINKTGYTLYKVTSEECYSWGGLSVCDDCNDYSSEGYLVPVLNHFMCPDCYNDWNSRCKFYSSDVEFENSVIMYYENILPFTVSPVPV